MVILMDFKDFKLMVGDTIMLCQMIEHDIKLIYAGMRQGDIYENLDNIEKEKWSLGQTIVELEQLDNSDNNPYFSHNDYRLLKRITYQRNLLCHKVFTTFLYSKDFINSKEYQKQSQQLLENNRSLKSLSEETQKIKIAVLKKYKRI